MLVQSLVTLGLLGGARLVAALGEEQVITFPSVGVLDHHDASSQVVLSSTTPSNDDLFAHFLIASQPLSFATHLLLDSKDNEAVHIAAQTFAQDVYKVTGVAPQLFNDTLPSNVDASSAIIVGTVDSKLIKSVHGSSYKSLEGKWESYDARVLSTPVEGVKEGLVIVGSDRRGTIYGLYTLSEQMGVSPWYYWSDVPVRHRPTIGFDKSKVLAHGEPTVKYRGLFINDEHPALWGWAQKEFKLDYWEPAFQTEFYRPWFEMLLRLKANYAWPAMYISAFRTDGLDISEGQPKTPIPGPNLVLSDSMGIIMGTSHHEPMERNKPEWDHFREGEWDWTNADFLKEFWRYGAERASDKDVLYTLGMRGDGDMPLTGASIGLVENITAVQRDILRDVYGSDEAYNKVPKMWAMYKEVAEYFIDGLEIPDDVTVLFADDNFGNIMSVLPPDQEYPGGGGIYYHVDYVGYPRAYKWINTINLAKTWEQMHIAKSFNTTQIWMLNVGSLKPLEMPSEHWLSLAYDFDAWPRNSVTDFLKAWAARDFGVDVADEVADIMGHYSIYASRRKPELLNSTMWSLINFNEAERVLEQWESLSDRAAKVYESLPEDTKPTFFQNVYMLCLMQTNINRLHIAVGRSNHYAYQGRTAANTYAKAALDAFYNDANLTNTFHSLLDGRWEHMLDQSHINWDTHLEPDRDSLPPISFVNPAIPVRPGIPVPELTIPHTYSTRVTVENSYGAWPGWTLWNCPGESKCPDPLMWTLDPYGAKTRWIDIGACGPREVAYTLKTDEDWLTITSEGGKLRRDASADDRVLVGVDWSKVPSTEGKDFSAVGHVYIKSADGANVTITVPISKPAGPPEDFVGFIEGDQYLVMEAAHHQRSTAVDEYSIEEIEWYGRSLSGMEMYPTTTKNFTVGTGPSIEFDFWTHGDSTDGNGTVEVTVQIGPTLNFILGKQLAFGFQIDEHPVKEIHPIPTERLGPQYERPGAPGLYMGAVPNDWPEIVRTDVRNVTIPVQDDSFNQAGAHTIKLFGMTTGIVFERVWVDLGGIQERGYSYLGPPESVLV